MVNNSFKKLRAILEAVEDVPVHPSDAGEQVPDKLKENSDEDLPTNPIDSVKLSEEDDEEKKEVTEESEEEKEIKEESEEEKDELSEEDDEEKKEVTEESEEEEDRKEISEEDEDDIIFDDEDVQDAMEFIEGDEEIKEESEEEKDELSEEDDEEKKEVTEESEEEEISEEDLEALTKQMPESFKQTARDIFESAVKRGANKKAKRIASKLMEFANIKHKKNLAKHKKNLNTKLDGYFDYLAESWMNTNKVAIENSIKVELMESLMGGLKNLFEAHNINIPTSKVNLIEELTKKVTALEKELNSSLNSNVELKKKNVLLVKESIINKMSQGLTKSDALKLKDLVKPLAFENEESFRKRVSSIKESYFKTPSSSEANCIDSQLISEGGVKKNEEMSEMDVLASLISRQVKNR